MSERNDAMLPRIALAGALLTLIVLASSAYLRLAQIGLGCDTWPACYGLRILDPRAPLPHPALYEGMRVAHRLAASAVGVLALAALVVAWRGARRARIAAGALVSIALLLAVLGRATGSSLAAPVALGNVIGGMAMLALFSYLMFGARIRVPVTRAVRVLAAAAAALLAAQIALGVMTSAQLAGRACPDLLACLAAGADPAAFNPFGVSTGPDTGSRAALNVAHRAGGVLTTGALLALAAGLWRRRAENRRPALALIVLTLVQGALGTVLVLFDLPLAAATAHNAVAALLVTATAFSLMRNTHERPRFGSSPRRRPCFDPDQMHAKSVR